MSEHPNLTVISHPLIKHKLRYIRDKKTPKKEFKELVDEVAMLMAYEITSDFPLRKVKIKTPMCDMDAEEVSGKKVVLVPILRAGLGMVDGVMKLIPSARIGHIGLYRDHDTLQPVQYYFKIPTHCEDRDFILIDPMLATGGSAAAAAQMLKEEGAKSIKFMSLIAAPEGVRAFYEAHPDIKVYTASLDEKLNEVGYIVPGLGDAGDRLFGTK
ncbi:uracil phosphoribosyltransferase [Limisalsivibrio acetivorans]|uniref:uracil phosphoribosyltransferase n=1 Tax=Limisalsivibrio acetivorans TaxID=1304888 RepID=UPI0003B4A200|nr:uracil phosphoribosyltransferase [Limisalsivibrio acetivorans]